RMVDVTPKPETVREAVAEGDVRMNAAAHRAIRTRAVKKGDPLQVARLAGIMAAKRTAEIIPLCHPLPLTHVDVDIRPQGTTYRIRSRVGTVGRTGVEMEALVAVSTAALTLYDMLKAVDKAMVIGRIRLLEKRGGRSGEYRRRRGRSLHARCCRDSRSSRGDDPAGAGRAARPAPARRHDHGRARPGITPARVCRRRYRVCHEDDGRRVRDRAPAQVGAQLGRGNRS